MTKKQVTINPLISCLTQIWAITGDALDMIAAHVVSAAQSALAPFSVDSRDPKNIDIRVVDGIAIIPMTGAIAKDHGWMSYYSGREFSGYLGIREKVEKALLMPNVKTILFNVDSPGGTVDGCKECADFLRAASEKKPIYTYVDGSMMSAAYWLGSVGKVIAAPETAQIGSIGVRTLHSDWSEYDKNMGIKYTHITAGKYKAIPNSDEPLSKEALDYVQSSLDQTYAIFVADVAGNRGIDSKKITDLEAKVLLAGPAVEAGLIDRIESDINTFIEYIKNEEDTLMDLATLKANHPDIHNQVMAEGAAAEKLKTEAAVKAAVASAMGVVCVVAGKDVGDRVEKLVSSGITAEQASLMVEVVGGVTPLADSNDQDAESRKAILDALKTSTHKPAGGDGHRVETEGLDFDALVEDHMDKKNCAKGEAMAAMAKKYPDAHEKWLKGKQKKA